jgi:hypothetical protein
MKQTTSSNIIHETDFKEPGIADTMYSPNDIGIEIRNDNFVTRK